MQDLLNFYLPIHHLHSHSWLASRQFFCCKLMTNFSSVQIPCSLLQHKDKFHCHIGCPWPEIRYCWLMLQAKFQAGYIFISVFVAGLPSVCGVCSYPDPTSSVSHVTGLGMGLRRHWMAYHLIQMVNSVSRVSIKATGKKLWTTVWDEASSFSC